MSLHLAFAGVIIGLVMARSGLKARAFAVSFGFAIGLAVLPLARGQAARTGPFGFSSSRGLLEYSTTDDHWDWGPRVATNGGQTWLAAYRSYIDLPLKETPDSHIYFIRSTNGGRAWSQPQYSNPMPETESDEDSAPTIAHGIGARWLLVWQTQEPVIGGGPGEYDIATSISDDDGASWSIPKPLNSLAWIDQAYNQIDGRPEMATDGLGNWVCAWLCYNYPDGTRSPDVDIHYARSSDDGTTWTAQKPLNSNWSFDTGIDFFPHVATDSKGTWLCVWATNGIDASPTSDNDIVFARSFDNGTTWTAPAFLNNNALTDTGDDGEVYLGLIRSGPKVATNGSGVWVCVWSSLDDLGGTIGTDPDILYARSTDNGATWSDPLPLNSNAATDQVSGNFKGDLAPQIVYDGNQNWVVVWETQAFTNPPPYEFDIGVSRSTDDGLTWSPVQALNSSYPSDTGWDYSPTLATDGKGRWVSIWSSTDPQFGGGGASAFAESDLVWASSCNLDPPPQNAILAYLLGLSPSPAGLDLNCDGQVDAADVLLRAP